MAHFDEISTRVFSALTIIHFKSCVQFMSCMREAIVRWVSIYILQKLYSAWDLAMDTAEYHYLGEFSLDGVVFTGDTPKDDIVHIRDDFRFLEDDIILATYPKAGKTCMDIPAETRYYICGPFYSHE